MLSEIKGVVVAKDVHTVFVKAENLTYEIYVARAYEFKIKDEVCLFLAEIKVQRQPIILVGFESNAERSMFNLLISVPRIGFKKALRILVLPLSDIAAAVRKNDVAALSLKSVGSVSAAQICLSLSGRLTVFEVLPAAPGLLPPPSPAELKHVHSPIVKAAIERCYPHFELDFGDSELNVLREKYRRDLDDGTA